MVEAEAVPAEEASAKKAARKPKKKKKKAKKKATRKSAKKKAAPKKKAARKNARGEFPVEPVELNGATKLVIVESPAKARTINKYLGKDFKVVASLGHVRDLPKNRLGIDIENDFAPHYIEIYKKRKHNRELRKAAKQVDEVYLCPDPDREGEAIAWHLMEALNVDEARAKRVTFGEITQRAVREAFAQPRKVDMRLVDAQQARRILDRLVGYKLSPLLWKKIIKRLSAGRVQSVAVRLICEREDEIDRFVAEEYWRVTATLTAPTNARIRFESDLRGTLRERREEEVCPLCGGKTREQATPRGKILRCKRAPDCPGTISMTPEGAVIEDVPLTNEAEARSVLERLGDAPFIVREVAKRESKGRPYPPFATSQMQQAAASRLRFTARKTMMLAQRLYEGVEMGSLGSVGLITYMRTDSFRAAPEAVDQARKFIGSRYGDDYLPEKPQAYRARKSAQEGHEAIRPTQVSMTPESVERYLEPDMLKLYRLIWQRFVASQMAPARYEDTSAIIDAGGFAFPAHGRVVLFAGCTAVYGAVQKKDEAGPKALPPIEPGLTLNTKSVEPSQHFTQPPPRYSEASLVKILEREGIGRPSTYAAIISTIQDRGYVRKEGSGFKATELGRIVNEKLVGWFPTLIDVKFTAEMEAKLDRVGEGTEDWVRIMHEFYDPFIADIERAEREMPAETDAPAPFGEVCEECGGPMVIKLSRKGRFLGCARFPECRFSMPMDPEGRGVALNESARGTRCPNCGEIMVLRLSRRGRFLGCTGFPKCRTMAPLDEEGNPVALEKTDEVCDKCGAPMQVRFGKWGKFLSCTAYPKCRNAKPMPGALPGEPAPGAGPCEECGSEMALRRTKRGGYLLCAKYPECKHRRTAEEVKHLLKSDEDEELPSGETSDEPGEPNEPDEE